MSFENLEAAFAKADVKLWEVFVLSDEELAGQVERSANEIHRFREYYRDSIPVAPTITAEPGPPVSTGDTYLDGLLGGGVHRGAVTEIFGAAGAGKTCFCCQAALSAAAAVYLCTEDTNWTIERRMRQLSPRFAESAIDNVRFLNVRDASTLRVALRTLHTLKPRPDIVVIDSIAALFLENHSSADAGAELADLGLRRVAMELNAAILVANQVRSTARRPVPAEAFAYDTQALIVDGDANPHDEELRQRPALGLAWANQVDARVVLRNTGGTSREVAVVFSSEAPPRSLALTMSATGLAAPVASGLDSDDEDEDLPKLP